VLILPATLTATEARDTLAMLSQALEREPHGVVVVDASALTRFDSAALALLLEIKRLALSFDRGFELRDPPARLVSLATVYGIDSVMGLTAAA
jgi:phospholipid transport system transporter-binding protein